MIRKILAFLAFNVYGALIVAAFQLNVPNIFGSEKLSDLAARGFSLDRNALGWDDHYIYRFVAAIVATALAGYLAAAFLTKETEPQVDNAFRGLLDDEDSIELPNSKRSNVSITPSQAGIFMLIANIPTIIVWGITFYLLTDSRVLADFANTSQTYFKWMCLIAIPATSVVAYFSGREGAQYQIDTYEHHKPLGISAGHWIWITIPFYIYCISIIAVAARLVQNFWYGWGDEGLFGGLIYLLSIIPLMAYVYPLQYSHQILTREWMPHLGSLARAGAAAGILIGGLILALVIDLVSVFGLAAFGYMGKPSGAATNSNNIYTVNTSEKWCSVINGEDLAKKNNVQKVDYDVAAIRIDFVEKLNQELVERLTDDVDGKRLFDDKQIQQMKDEKRIGAWVEQDGTTWRLHVADPILPAQAPKRTEMVDKWIKAWHDGLDADRSNSEKQDASIECAIRSLDNFFDELILHSDERQESIKLRHTARTYEK